MTELRPGISGYVPVRNGIKLDYCFEAAIEALLEGCDEVVVCDSDSSDGTREFLNEWALVEPRLRVINYPWPDPVNDGRMLVKWLNFTRGHLKHEMQIASDADEVLCPKSWPAIREVAEKKGCLWFYRLHFWRDAQHVTQDNKVVGSHVARLGPTEYEMTSDEMRFEGEPPIRAEAVTDDRARFFHYGFLRRPKAFFEKSRVMQRALCNTYDARLVEAEKEGDSWEDHLQDTGELVPYTANDQPKVAWRWLQERGYRVRGLEKIRGGEWV